MTKKLVGRVAHVIKAVRKEKGMSQENLAERAGLDRTYISGIERAVRNITLESLEAIVGALDISIEDFLRYLIETDVEQ